MKNVYGDDVAFWVPMLAVVGGAVTATVLLLLLAEWLRSGVEVIGVS